MPAQRRRAGGPVLSDSFRSGPADAPEGFAPEPEPGPRYERLGLLGAGGMGRVYLARDRRLDRLVALKEASGDTLALAREARVTAGLEHPGIVAIYDDGTTHEGRPFYTMRLVRGRPLSQIIADTPVLQDRIRLLRPLLAACEAMAYAHARGVIHRDLKPANIVLGEHGETQVVDWGLAVTLEEEARPAGTPAYMSPEVRAGGRADRRSDVWGLGMVMRELLWGATPGESPPEEEVPPELLSILHRALRPAPEARYPDAAALAADLAAWLDGRRVSAYSYSTRELAMRLARAWRAPLWVAGASLALFAAMSALGALRLQAERDRAIDAEKATREALIRSDHHLANSLLERARRALSADSLLEAELSAVNALLREDTPEARGLLAGARAGERTRRVERGPAPDCPMFVALSTREQVCAGAGALWRLQDGEERWRVTGPSERVEVHGDQVVGYGGGAARAWDRETGAPAGEVWEVSTMGPLVTALPRAQTQVLRDLFVSGCGAVGAEGGAVDPRGHIGIVCEDGRAGRGPWTSRIAPSPAFDMRGFGDALMVALAGDALLVLGDVRGRIGVADLATRAVYTREATGVDAPRRLAVDTAGTRLAVGRESGRVDLLTLPDLRLLAVYPSRGLRDLRILDDGSVLIADEQDLSRWSPPKDERFPVFRSERGLTGVAFSPDGTQLLSTHSGGLALLRDLRGPRVVRVEQGEATIKGGAFFADGLRVALVSVGPSRQSGPLYLPRVFDARSGEELWAASEALVRAWSARIIPEIWGRPEIGMRRVGVLSDGLIVGLPYFPIVLAARVGEDAPVWLDCPAGEYFDLSVVGGGAFALLSDGGGELYRLDVGSDRCVRVAGAPGLGAVDGSPDGRFLVAGGQGSLSRLLEGSWTVAHPSPYPLDVALSPNLRWVASAGPDRAARVFDARDGRLVAVLQGHSERVAAVAFSPDGQTLATGSWDGSLRLWDMTVLDLSAQQLADAAEARQGVDIAEVLGR